MANVYKSRYTGEQIEQLLNKANDIQTITAFPDPQDGDYLGAIEIDNIPYLIPKGTSVSANEGAREGGYLYTIEIGADKFLLPKYVEAINAASAGSGTPLKKLIIGDILYEIPQGAEVKANDGAVEGGYLYTITIGVDKYLLPKYVEAITTSSVPEGVELKGLTIGNQNYVIPAGVTVKANDGAVEGGYLRTLTIGNDKFLLPDYITPNPTADATQTLRKIAIGNVIYELPSGVTPVYYDGEFSTRPIGGVELIRTLTLVNIGAYPMYYAVDANATDNDAMLLDGESVVLTDINSFVDCITSISFLKNESTFTDCEVVWDTNTGYGGSCRLYPKSENATANLYAYD